MKKVVFVYFGILMSFNVVAADLTGTDTYYGKINSVSVGFFSNVGVALQDGTTCNGQKVAVLLTTNPKYKEILSLLLTAETSQKEVHFYRVASNLSQFGTPPYCVINEAALGKFPLWPL